MNIQRFKWPVIVAAGLHGALLMVTPDQKLIPDTALVDKPEALPPIPKEDLIQIYDVTTDSEPVPAGGGASVPALPESVAALPDTTVFTMTAVDRVQPTQFETSLLHFTGGEGPEAGPVDYPTGRTISVVNLDRQPRATAQLSPDYPASMRQQGIAGSVTVEFEVNTEGHVVRADVVSCTRREFAEPALRAVRRWQFEPGRRHGQVVPFRMTVPIEFGLNE